MHDAVKIRLKGSSRKGGFLIEEVNGDDWYRDRCKYVHKSRRIDRSRNVYQETVTDGENGEVIRHIVERLSDHKKGHLRRR